MVGLQICRRPGLTLLERCALKDENRHELTIPLSSTARIANHPIHPMLVPIPIACFIGALITDIVYSVTAEMMWADFSVWLLLVGLICGALAAIAGLTDF